MKTIKSFIVAAAFAVVLTTIPTAQAAKLDFSKMAGRYKATFVITAGTTTIPGNVTVTVTVPENGSKAKIQIVGYGSAGSSGNIALVGNLSLTSRHQVTADNALLAFYIQLPAAPTKFAGSKNKLTFTLAGTSLLGNANMTYTLTFNGKRLSIAGNGSISSQAASVVMTGKKQGK